ncbi:MAG: type II secretion system protein [Candidatus Omnitrophica bacterium]|nr:type II secretion system protein [Candidatus Omnitrophota bacterium]
MNFLKVQKILRVHNQRSFTLIELLVGIAIFTIIASSVYLTFINGIKIENQSLEAGQLYGESRWLISALETDLENAVTYSYRKNGEALDLNAFRGINNSLSFIIPTATGLKGVRYYLMAPEASHIYKTVIGQTTKKNVRVETGESRSASIKWLVREEIPFYKLINNIAADSEEIEILSRSIKEDSFEFSYGIDEGESRTNMIWKTAWTEQSLPAGVRLKVTIINPDNEEKTFAIERDFMIPVGYWAGNNMSLI